VDAAFALGAAMVVAGIAIVSGIHMLLVPKA